MSLFDLVAIAVPVLVALALLGVLGYSRWLRGRKG